MNVCVWLFVRMALCMYVCGYVCVACLCVCMCSCRCMFVVLLLRYMFVRVQSLVCLFVRLPVCVVACVLVVPMRVFVYVLLCCVVGLFD